MSEHKYKLLYTIHTHPEGQTGKEVMDLVGDDGGGCDAVLLCSLIYPEDGGFSCYFLGVDGREAEPKKQQLQDIEWFKVLALLSGRLAESKTLSKEKKDLCLRAFEAVRTMVLGNSLN